MLNWNATNYESPQQSMLGDKYFYAMPDRSSHIFKESRLVIGEFCIDQERCARRILKPLNLEKGWSGGNTFHNFKAYKSVNRPRQYFICRSLLTTSNLRLPWSFQSEFQLNVMNNSRCVMWRYLWTAFEGTEKLSSYNLCMSRTNLIFFLVHQKSAFLVIIG